LLSAVVVGIVVAAGLGWFSFARYSDDRPIFPDLVGLTEAAAVSQITSRGNQVEIVRRPSSKPAGKVIAQRVSRRGSRFRVVLVVSTG
jgi:beta-lactam-binding protein with PASTA domain